MATEIEPPHIIDRWTSVPLGDTVASMRKPEGELRRGWTTGACATAATTAALTALWSATMPKQVTITLPRGETPEFPVAEAAEGPGWAMAGVVKDAGDDPDVTHGALIQVTVRKSEGGIVFRAGHGVGTVTKPGLPIAVGEPAINPVPRQMMSDAVRALAKTFDQAPDIEIEISVPGGEILAAKTWNPRLGIVNGISILGTTGIVRPFSCAAWIASIHRGIDVARADGLQHVAGCTGATSEATVRALYDLPEHAMLDMGDFAGGMLKYLVRHPVPRLTLGGGFAKMTKLAQGARDLHSARSEVDMALLAKWARRPDIATMNTAMAALETSPDLGAEVATRAQKAVADMVPDIAVDTVVVARDGTIVGRA